MNLSALTPYPILDRPPEISDADLKTITGENLRADLEKLLRARRAPALYLSLRNIRELARVKLDALADERDPNTHRSVNIRRSHWSNIAAVCECQMDWLLRRTTVHADEVYDLVNRWLLLHFDVEPTDYTRGVRLGAGT